MSQTFQATVSQSDLQSATLAQLLSLPLESRYVSILQAGRNDLTATLRSLRDVGAPLPLGLDAERLAWAVAFNVEGPSTSGAAANSAPLRGAQGYSSRWLLDTPWRTI